MTLGGKATEISRSPDLQLFVFDGTSLASPLLSRTQFLITSKSAPQVTPTDSDDVIKVRINIGEIMRFISANLARGLPGKSG